MDHESTVKLIEAVSRYPVLYKSGDPEYKSLEKRSEAWREIELELKQDCESLKTRWRSLRDCYTKYKRSFLTTTGPAAKKYYKWPWSRHMSFLDGDLSHFMTTLGPISSNFDGSIESTSVFAEETDLEQESTDASTSAIEINEEAASSSCYVQSESCRKRKLDPSDKVICCLQEYDRERKEKKSDVELLFMSYAETFKKFSPLTQAKLKVELANVFAEAEIKEIAESLLRKID